MKTTPVEELFYAFNESAEILEQELDCTYLEAVAETGENIFQQSILQTIESDLALKRLQKIYEGLNLAKFSREEIRKAFQLAILKGMKESTQPNHQMTPDSIGILFGYLLNKFMTKNSYRLLDPAVGTGNLLTAAMNQSHGKQIEAIGIEIDDLLLKLAFINANLQQHPIEFFHQDGLKPLFIEKVDAVICDLPVGYYPDDIRAAEFEIKADKGHTYAHHLFIEQSIRHVKDGGYLFFLIPNGLFESEQAKKLHEYLKKTAYVQAVMQLPESLFINKQNAKSIFILQKKGEGVKAPKQALLVKMPSLTDGPGLEKILIQIDQWIRNNKK